jgi:methylphosphotriester-DNA--protein-cysteine methyltransferase
MPLERIIKAARRHRQVVAAARELGCSAAYVHKRFKAAGLTLAQVLEVPDVQELLKK